MNERFEGRLIAYGKAVIRWRWPVLGGVLLLAALAAFGASRLGFATNYRVFFSEDNPDLAAFEAVQNIYTKNDNILFVVEPAGGEVFTRGTLEAVADLTERAWQIPYSIRVDSITNFQHTRAEGDDLTVEDLVADPRSLGDEELRDLRAIALSRPELVNRLIGPSTDVTGVNVTLQLAEKDPTEVFESAGMARTIAAEIEETYPEIKVRLTGLSMLNNAFAESGMTDFKTLMPLMYAVFIVALVVLLRSVWATVSTVSVIGLSAAVAMGIAGWAGLLISPILALAPTMILTMAIADSVHVLTTLLDEMRSGRSKVDAIVESLRINFVPVFLTSITTAIGFLAMNFSDSPPMRHLGSITAVGVLAAWVLSATFLPAMVAVLPLRVKVRSASSEAGPSLFDRFGARVVANNRLLLGASVGMFLLLLVFLPTNRIDDRFVQYFDRSMTFRQDTDFATERLTGVYQLQFSIPSGEPGGISEPDYLSRLDNFTEWLRSEPEVVHVNSLSDTFRRLNMNMHADDPAYYRLPEDRELAAQYLLLYEMSLPYGLDLNNRIDVDKSSTQVVATVGEVSTRDYLDLAGRAERWLDEHGTPAMAARATGPAVMFGHITQRNVRSMIWGTLLAFTLISAILVVALRSLKLGLLSLIPNVIPAAMAFGAWGILVGEVGFAVSVVAALTMGIVVDDSVHFLAKYLRARREKDLEAPDAVRYAFSSVGRALWVTSVVLIAGFVTLAQSTFKQNSDLGLLSAVTIAFALVADFLLLPGLLIAVDRRKKARQVAPLAAERAFSTSS
jgi:predicted RND superfamily exporter protein